MEERVGGPHSGEHVEAVPTCGRELTTTAHTRYMLRTHTYLPALRHTSTAGKELQTLGVVIGYEGQRKLRPKAASEQDWGSQ